MHAKKKALKQGVAVEGPEKFAQYMKSKGEGRIKPHLPIYTKHRKGKGQFKRKAANDKNTKK